jgi:cell division protease FtsH
VKIDAHVRRLVEAGYARAKQIIEERAEALTRIAEALLEREVLDGAEVNQLIEGLTLAPVRTAPRPGGDDKPLLPATRPEGGLRVPGLREGENPQPA